MTLVEWCDRYGVKLNTHAATGTLYVQHAQNVPRLPPAAAWELCHLSDYVRSGLFGPMSWMVPRDRPAARPES